MTTRLQNKAQTSSSRPATWRRWFRKALLMPAEHGAWSWLLVPFLVGAVIAPAWSWSSALVLIGGLSLFLVRQPAIAWLRIRQGRGRQSDESVALFWTVLFALAALLSLLGLLAARQTALLWLAPPVLAILALYVAVSQINRAQVRNLWMELAGAAGLAIMAPAAFLAGGGQLAPLGWLLWLLLAIQNCLGAHYIRQRIADSHKRPRTRSALLFSHVAGLGLALGSLLWVGAHVLALTPFVFLLLRALWASAGPRPAANIKRVGFTEVAVELAAGLWLAFTLLLP